MPGGATTASFAQRLRALFAPVKFWEVAFSSSDLKRYGLFVFRDRRQERLTDHPRRLVARNVVTAALPIPHPMPLSRHEAVNCPWPMRTWPGPQSRAFVLTTLEPITMVGANSKL
jgi:hypothetical protein